MEKFRVHNRFFGWLIVDGGKVYDEITDIRLPVIVEKDALEYVRDKKEALRRKIRKCRDKTLKETMRYDFVRMMIALGEI